MSTSAPHHGSPTPTGTADPVGSKGTPIDHIVKANAGYAGAFIDPGLSPHPARRVAIVTCMDTRLDPGAALGLAVGDCHTIRNAGGVVTDDIIRSLTLSQRAMGTRSVMLVKHTDCGLLKLTEEFRHDLEREVGQRPPWALESFKNLDQEVRQSIRRVRSSPFLLHTDDVRGFVLDVATGLLREVDPEVTADQ